MEQHCYLYAKDVVRYVKSTFGVEYTIPGMICWLKSHGFSYKKPAVAPGKANHSEQEAWINQYQELKKNLPSNETICFIDGVHPTHNVKIAYGWIKKGKRQEIPSNTGRRRINLSGMIDIFSKKVLFQEDVSLNAESTIAFLRKIESAYPLTSKIHLFCDNAKYYKNASVKEFLKESKIQMHFLPPYSPNLNSIERLWKVLYEEVFYNRYYEKFIDFKEAVYGFLQGLENPCEDMFNKISRRVTDNFRAIHGAIFGKNYGTV